jgi:hypothetical protein
MDVEIGRKKSHPYEVATWLLLDHCYLKKILISNGSKVHTSEDRAKARQLTGIVDKSVLQNPLNFTYTTVSCLRKIILS